MGKRIARYNEYENIYFIFGYIQQFRLCTVCNSVKFETMKQFERN